MAMQIRGNSGMMWWEIGVSGVLSARSAALFCLLSPVS